MILSEVILVLLFLLNIFLSIFKEKMPENDSRMIEELKDEI